MPTKTYRSSVTSKLLENFDDPLPGIITFASQQKQDISVVLMDYLNTGWYSRAEKFFNYGMNKYSRGLPEQSNVAVEIDGDEIKRIISAESNNKILIIYSNLSTESSNHYVKQFLQDVRHMDPLTNQVPTLYKPPGTPVNSYEITYLGYEVLGTNFRLNYIYQSSGEYFDWVEELPIEFTNEFVYQVEYQKLNNSLVSDGIPRYWMYEKGIGTYPTLDGVVTSESTVNSGYYPIVPFYEDKTRLGDPSKKGNLLYDTTAKLVGKLGLNYQDISDSLVEGAEDTIGNNKGLYAYLYLAAEVTAGIPFNYEDATGEDWYAAQKDAQPTLNYLMEFFKNERSNSKFTKTNYTQWEESPTSGYSQWLKAPDLNTFTISDGSFKCIMYYAYIDVSTKEGNIGDVGWCTNFVVPFTGRYGDTGLTSIDLSRIRLQRQLEFNLYEEVEVVGLIQNYLVVNNYVEIGVQDAFLSDSGQRTLITVPLDRNIVRNRIHKSFRNRLIHASIYFIFNTYIRVDIAWYQTRLFKAIFTAIAIYLAIPTGGASFTLQQLVTVAGLKAAAYTLVVSYLNYLIYKEIIKFVAKEFGIETAYIFSLVLMAYGKFGSRAGSKGMPWASELLEAGASMWSASNKYVQDQAKEVQRDFNRLAEQEDIAQKELNRANELLDTGTDLNPWLFVNPLPDLMFSQDSSTFIDNKIHVTNPGITALKGPSNYVELMLTLPTIDDTLTK
jgi:hypothetical protein